LITPTLVCSCIGCVRRCTNRRPLRGENFAVLSGFCLQSLLESLSGPLAAFGFHFQFDLPQGSGARLFRIHPFPFVEVRR
jgi:hypothetical protein